MNYLVVMLKRLVAMGRTDGLKDKLDMFLLHNRLNDAEYAEVLGLIEIQETPPVIEDAPIVEDVPVVEENEVK